MRYKLNSYLIKIHMMLKNECYLTFKKLFITMRIFTTNDITYHVMI